MDDDQRDVRKDFVEAMVTISLAIAARGGHVETDERGQAAGVVDALDRMLAEAREEGRAEAVRSFLSEGSDETTMAGALAQARAAGAAEEREAIRVIVATIDDDAVRASAGTYTGRAAEVAAVIDAKIRSRGA